ncbi:MAG: GIY-YIG nuclease family protein [Patescibacteria group bacterium]
MFYIYILHCGDKKLYTGYTTNIEKRLKRHRSGEVFSTKGRQPVELIFLEAFKHMQDAKRREVYLKTTAGKRAVKLMLREHFKE